MSELLCYFVVAKAQRCLAPATVRTHLSAVPREPCRGKPERQRHHDMGGSIYLLFQVLPRRQTRGLDCTAFNPAVHLVWGDVASDDSQPPTMVHVSLKQSKTDRFGHGVSVDLGAMGDNLCSMMTVLAFMANRRSTPRPLFRFTDGISLTKTRFVARIQGTSRASLTHSTQVIASASGRRLRQPQQVFGTQQYRPWADRAPQPS